MGLISRVSSRTYRKIKDMLKLNISHFKKVLTIQRSNHFQLFNLPQSFKTPIERGLYLVSLHDPKKTLESLPSPTDFEFLENMMELNEKAEGLDNDNEIEEFRKGELNDSRNDLVDRIQLAFDKDDLDAALEILGQLE